MYFIPDIRNNNPLKFIFISKIKLILLKKLGNFKSIEFRRIKPTVLMDDQLVFNFYIKTKTPIRQKVR